MLTGRSIQQCDIYRLEPNSLRMHDVVKSIESSALDYHHYHHHCHHHKHHHYYNNYQHYHLQYNYHNYNYSECIFQNYYIFLNVLLVLVSDSKNNSKI